MSCSSVSREKRSERVSVIGYRYDFNTFQSTLISATHEIARLSILPPGLIDYQARLEKLDKSGALSRMLSSLSRLWPRSLTDYLSVAFISRSTV